MNESLRCGALLLRNFILYKDNIFAQSMNIYLTNKDSTLFIFFKQTLPPSLARLANRSELSRQKRHTQELLSQLEMANEKVAEVRR